MKGICDGANGEVFFPKGVYRVTGPVVFENSVNVRGEKGALVVNETRDQPTFYFKFGYRVYIDSLAFEGGSVHVHQWTENWTDASMFISRCRFSGASDAAVISKGVCLDVGGYLDNEARKSLPPYEVVRLQDGRVRLVDNYEGKKLAWFWNSTLINIERCLFDGNAAAFRIASDINVYRECIIRADGGVPEPAAGTERHGSETAASTTSAGLPSRQVPSAATARGGASRWSAAASTPRGFSAVRQSRFFFTGVWLTLAPDRPTGCHRASYSCIENFQGGTVLAEDVCGVPRYFENSEVFSVTPGKVGDYRWVDNYGKYSSWQFRYGGERRGITPIYNHPEASSYAEGSISYHKNNGHLRPLAAAAAMSSEKDDVRFVDVMGFNFTVNPSFYLAVQGKDGSYGGQAAGGHVFNCFPFD